MASLTRRLRARSASLGVFPSAEVEMAKTLIDVDEESLAAAAEVLQAVTKKETVNAALRAVAALAARRRDLHRLVSGGLATAMPAMSGWRR